MHELANGRSKTHAHDYDCKAASHVLQCYILRIVRKQPWTKLNIYIYIQYCILRVNLRFLQERLLDTQNLNRAQLLPRLPFIDVVRI